MLGVVLATAGAGEALAAQSGRATPRTIALVSEYGWMLADTGIEARARLRVRSAASHAAFRVHTIDVTPDVLELAVRDEVPLEQRLTFVARDSAGRVIEGWAPEFGLTDESQVGVASLLQSHLVGALPGTLTLRVNARVFNDSTWRRGVPPPPASALVRVVVRPAVYTRPPRAPETPREVVQAFVGAVLAERWEEATTYADVAGFQAWLVSRLRTRRVATGTLVSIEQFAANMARAGGDTLPRAELERRYEALRRARQPETLNAQLLAEFGGILPEVMDTLPPERAAALFMEQQDPRVHLRRLGESPCDSAITRYMALQGTLLLRVIGVAEMNASNAWAMVAVGPSQHWQASPERAPAQLRMRRDADGRWRVDPQGVRAWSVGHTGRCSRTPRTR